MDVINFLDKSYTAYHAVRHSQFILEKHGFEKLNIANKWNLRVGGKYYTVKNGTSVIAFVIGENFAFNIAASHTDSPCLHIKGKEVIPSPEGARLNVETYGGLILYSMLDAPLKIAGRTIEKHGDALVNKVVESDYFVNIPSLAIHHNPNVNSAFSVSVQKDMLPLIGEVDDFYATLSKDEIVDADLYVAPATSPFRSGANGEYLCSPRIDNLTSVYTSLTALVSCNPQNIAICACFDNEEIGSRTKQGAASSLLQTVLEKIASGLKKSKDDYVSACENGFILSIDNAHAMHPAFPEKTDVKERVYMGKGIVIKHHVNYSTDGESSALLKTILDKAGVDRQDYYNNSDLRCGGTLGLMASANLGMRACDIGLAQLAMHSAVETVAYDDIAKMQACIKEFFDVKIKSNGDIIEIK